jgi:glycosyltransferase involved in cell wall biosynthesis
MRLSLVIPCYNEAENIPLLAERIADLRRKLPDIEILLVDNGSTDDSQAVFRKTFGGNRIDNVKIIKVPVNQGYGYGILEGLREATGDFLAWTHADLQTDLLDVATAFNIAQEANHPQNVIIKGSRKHRPIFDSAFTFGMSILSSIALGTRINDVNAQPKIFPRGLFNKFENPPWDFSLDLYLLYLARSLGYTCLTVPVNFHTRVSGVAKGGGSIKLKVKLTKRTFSYILKLRAELKKGGL